MIDFYNYSDFGDYPITPEMGIDEIHDRLADLRRIWNQREIHNPQKARIVLTALDQADQAFESEESKKAYDRQLAQQNQRGNNENPPGYSSDSDFIDFYNAGLGISRTMSSQQIVDILTRLKNTIQNAGFDPEQYSKLSLIERGLVVFQDDFSKAQYDAELDRKNKKAPVNDAEQERQNKLKQLCEKAVRFYDDKLYDEAYQVAQEALSCYKPEEDDFLLYKLLGNICVSKKDEAQAVYYYKKCIVNDPNNPYYYAWIAYLLSWDDSKESADCRKYAEKAIEKAQACKNDEYVARGYGVLAASYWIQTPQDLELALQYAKQYAEADTWGRAKNVLEYRKELSKLHYEKAQALFSSDNDSEAYAVAQEGLKYYKPEEDSFSLYMLLGNICADMKDYDHAISYYKKSIALDPDNPLYYMLLALVLEDRPEDASECRKYAEKTIEKAKACKNDEYVANGYGILAASYWRQKPQNQTRAVEYATKYVKTDTTGNAELVLNLKKVKDQNDWQNLWKWLTPLLIIGLILIFIISASSSCSGKSSKKNSNSASYSASQSLSGTTSSNISGTTSSKTTQSEKPITVTEKPSSGNQSSSTNTSTISVAVGDSYKFGTYEQDNNSSNGKEPIEWQVISKDGSRILVISKYALDTRKYHSSKDSITWENCSLRNWLNNDFLKNAFSAEEQKKIQSVTVTADKNPDSSATPGNNTTDKVFLLSITEVNKYLKSSKAKLCEPTKYTKSKNVYSGYGYCWWWLRSPGGRTMYAAFVDIEGVVSLSGSNVNYGEIGVRPALWINLG